MKKKLRNITATILSLAIATPFAIRAEYTPVNGDNISADYYNNAVQLVNLDNEAVEELSELGYEMDAEATLADDIIEYAEKYLGTPYRYGAKGPKAFDCSGFTSYIFGQHGIELNPSSKTQAMQGTELSLDEVQPGDLLFFGGRAGGKTVGHVAMAVEVDNDGTIKFIHASVSKGISYNTYPDGGYYSKRFLGARRVIE